MKNLPPITSNWPLPKEGIRFVMPQSLCDALAHNPLSANLYPEAMGYYPQAASHQMQRDTHTGHLLIYCTAGRGTLTLEGAHHRIRSGDLILLPPGIAHRYSAHPKYPWSIYWLHFAGDLSNHFVQLLNMNTTVEYIGLQPRITSQLEELFMLRNSGYDATSFIHGSHQLQQMLSHLALILRQQRSQGGTQIDIDDTRSFMNEHLHGQLSLDDLAKHSKLSKYHFSKRFKALTGHSPIEFFIHLKIQYACHLLDSSTQTIKQVAASLGYEDAYYFSRIFKKVIGLSPDQYRKSKHR
jgi:AraC-like DNA-binding protein